VFIGRRIRLCGSRSRAQSAPRCFARDCARLAALTVRSANLKSATTDGLAWTSRGPLDDARQRRYSEVLFDGCNSQPPSHRPMWSTLIGGPGHDSFFFSRFTPWSATRTTTCPGIARSDRTAFRPQARAPDPFILQIDIVTLSRLHACHSSIRQEPHSVLPIHSRTRTRNRHRRSTWGGRIMAERRRHQRGRWQERRPHTRANANRQVDARGDDNLRALVRVLARHAARELFEAQQTRHPSEAH
jgi:hypothetical protein